MLTIIMDKIFAQEQQDKLYQKSLIIMTMKRSIIVIAMVMAREVILVKISSSSSSSSNSVHIIKEDEELLLQQWQLPLIQISNTSAITSITTTNKTIGGRILGLGTNSVVGTILQRSINSTRLNAFHETKYQQKYKIS